ncbi:MAG: hypothetical protein HKP19_03715 [Xanthomonadales bacterium]|nr:hypothetical protein [Xanthomonadales bacterium]
MGCENREVGSYDRRSIRDQLLLVLWIFVWMATLTIADKAHLHGWWVSDWAGVAGILLNIIVGLGMVGFFMHMLKRMDDLQRKIQLDALSLSLGISLVGCSAYMLAVTWGFIVDEEVSDMFMLMCLSYAASAMFMVWRYR